MSGYCSNGRVRPSRPWRELLALLRDQRILLLVITGDRDVEVDEAVAREAAGLRAHVVRIAGAGHCVRREQPSAYHAAVDRFLKRLA